MTQLIQSVQPVHPASPQPAYTPPTVTGIELAQLLAALGPARAGTAPPRAPIISFEEEFEDY